ncbi:H/ACA ribonucleoprotein complex non-core subunit NAF1-like [Haliotis rubra]|uniref:H/ACA ribonucleoprotein complex non-core subunit NAF1-like n=1 Tax=Haliotis rubra TaxID=36100 RepID=UPI001EE531C1|nr:H/ACA ribonucleoprotein complex non-core subunit NAF1-like [Haliotis rubra]XP_046584729.1 H/ACA ribonucleoprotein complex non-core subunit NAF1-like [Haliotis rubra]
MRKQQEGTHCKSMDEIPVEGMKHAGPDSVVSENGETNDTCPTDANLENVVRQKNDVNMDSKADVTCDSGKSSLKEEHETNKEEKKEDKMEREETTTETIIKVGGSHETNTEENGKMDTEAMTTSETIQTEEEIMDVNFTASNYPEAKTEITMSAVSKTIDKKTEQEGKNCKSMDEIPVEGMKHAGPDSVVSENGETKDTCPTDSNLDKVATQKKDVSKVNVTCDSGKSSLKEEDETIKEEKKEDAKMETETITTTETISKDDKPHKTKPVSMAYRGDGDSSSDEADSSEDSDSSISTTSGSDLEEPKPETVSDREEEEEEKPGKKKKAFDGIRTRGELYPEELPPLEELKISVDETVEMQEIGKVSGIVGILVIIQASKNMPALDEETVLFNENREALGKIFEVFGTVASPFYSVRFNSLDDITDKNIVIGLSIYCAPKEQEYTQFVFVEQLKRIKGSDASWENNNEPPSWCMEFSDDEDEKRMKSKNRNKTAPKESNADDESANKKPRNNRKKKMRGEGGNGTTQDSTRGHSKMSNQRGGRGGHSWPPKQTDSWPPNDGSNWPPKPQETWMSSQNDEWQPQMRQYGSRGHSSRPFISPPNFQGGRGGNRQSGGPRFTAQFQNQPRGPPFGGHQGQHIDHQGHLSNHGFQSHNFRGGPFHGHSDGFSQGHSGFNNPIVDTRLMQNSDQGEGPFTMIRPPNSRSTFGGQPHFTAGPMGGGYPQRPSGPGVTRFTGAPAGRW